MAKVETETKVEAADLVMKLKKPITVKGVVYDKLPYREATGRDMRKALNIGKSGDRYMSLLVDLFELPEEFWNSVPAPVFMAATNVADRFFEAAQPE